ncbi:MAG TPA: UDP-N-acetylmuramoyl-tripeptide--D-alanyl-D-alanine ligase [Spirochaetia bacterium]|nr:UDP-N-acetylmuramoyl-tripeptide--D-alanyl-D-alanine ligase [Spirochaetia bacterium]
MDITLGEAARATGAVLRGGDPDGVITGVSTDTRTLKQGDLFIALRGDNFDGRSFVDRAREMGAAGAVVARDADGAAGALLAVDDTLVALQRLAAWYRQRFDFPVIGVTGSVGKTGTKDMIAGVLGGRLSVHKTPANLNNEIGLPLTLLALRPGHQAAVLEMAMRASGEIDQLCRLAGPTAGVITTVGESHLEFLGSVENIARAKGELLDHIPAQGFALLGADHPLLRREAARCRGKVIFYGQSPDADLVLTSYRPEGTGAWMEVRDGTNRAEYFLPLAGRHNAVNALAAIGVARELGLSSEEIGRGLSTLRPAAMRLAVLDLGRILLIDDAYNASPTSTGAALETLAQLAGNRRKVAVLGDMLELGELAPGGHRVVGAAAAAQGVDLLVTVGNLAGLIAEGARLAGLPESRVFSVPDNRAALELLADLLGDADVVLVKGSRGMHMEEIVAGLQGRYVEC